MTEFEFALLLAITFFVAAVLGAEFADPQSETRRKRDADR